jgi:amidase
MTGLDLTTATATDAIDALAAGDISSVELLDAHLARIEQRNGDLNAVVAFDVERARARAAAADNARSRGISWGPLHGLAMTIKDAFETEGLVTTSGAPELADHVPEHDADAVALLKGAGAIVFAKTNLPLYAGDMQTYNEVYGTTNNPWDVTRTPGGSSGGAAAAIASGMTLLELGSDIGGSIRTPSHYCGVFGHKPSFGVVPFRGHVPPAPGTLAETDLGVMGPMGRSVADLTLAMAVLTTGGVRGVPGSTLPAPRDGLDSLADVRIGVWLDDPACPTDAAVLTVLERAVAALGEAGAKVVDDARPATPLADTHPLYARLLSSALAAGYPDAVIDAMRDVAAAADPADSTAPTEMVRGLVQSHRDWVLADERRAAIKAQWAALFETVDVVIAPITPVVAPLHDNEMTMDQRTITVNGGDRPYMDQIIWAGVATMPHLPATAIPAGRSTDGLPVGFQIIGPELGDRTTLRVAALAEAVLGGFVAPPGS